MQVVVVVVYGCGVWGEGVKWMLCGALPSLFLLVV